MKKVLAAALLCAVSSFAAWDKFPVLGYGKGEARVGVLSTRQANNGGFGGAYVDIRYNPLENLELMASQPFGEDYSIGARYQVISLLAAGVDIGFPMPGTNWSFKPSVQFSMEMGALAIGSNLGLTIYTTEDIEFDTGFGPPIEAEYSKSMDLEAGIEVDFTIGKSTLWVGFDIEMGLGESETKAKEGGATVKTKAKDEGRGMALKPAVGYIAGVSDNLSLSTFVEWGLGGKDAGNDPMTTTVGVEFAVKF
jgi:hypothetical protein